MFWAVACEFGFKVLIWPKNFSLVKFNYKYSKKRRVEKNGKRCYSKSYRPKSVEFCTYCSSPLPCQSFWPITCSRCICFLLLQRIWNQRNILRFWKVICKKTIKKFWGSLSTNRVCFRISKNASSQEMA